MKKFKHLQQKNKYKSARVKITNYSIIQIIAIKHINKIKKANIFHIHKKKYINNQRIVQKNFF